jgi:hypothetical protein
MQTCKHCGQATPRCREFWSCLATVYQRGMQQGVASNVTPDIRGRTKDGVSESEGLGNRGAGDPSTGPAVWPTERRRSALRTRG